MKKASNTMKKFIVYMADGSQFMVEVENMASAIANWAVVPGTANSPERGQVGPGWHVALGNVVSYREVQD